jgi:hypothetical protein
LARLLTTTSWWVFRLRRLTATIAARSLTQTLPSA